MIYLHHFFILLSAVLYLAVIPGCQESQQQAKEEDPLIVISETGAPLIHHALEGPLSLLAGMPVKIWGAYKESTIEVVLVSCQPSSVG
jgi:hypothetical protein